MQNNLIPLNAKWIVVWPVMWLTKIKRKIIPGYMDQTNPTYHTPLKEKKKIKTSRKLSNIFFIENNKKLTNFISNNCDLHQLETRKETTNLRLQQALPYQNNDFQKF